MSVTLATRGSTLIFTATFLDVSGAVTSPASANLYVTYRIDGDLATDTVPMVQSGSTWMASWDSAVADGGRAEWHVRSAGSNKAASEGAVQLRINAANPATP